MYQQTNSASPIQEPEQSEQSTQPVARTAHERRWELLLYSMIVLETLLVLLALVPAQLWTHLLPTVDSAALDGPFPPAIAPLVSLLLYVLPTLIGLLSKSWQRALLYATLPAWIGLGVFLVAATFRIGAFYLVASDHVAANVSILELFAALGSIGWLARLFFKMR
ncbi:MAG TPA: hypothetical protein DHW02_02985 [Ktedonobacter sp.]|nr:hypothetical protein [Ktedonobacter sp.]